MSRERVKSIIAGIGRDRLSADLSVTDYAIRHAATAGAFPSAWYLVLKELADEAGVDCPDELFNFKSPSASSAPDGSLPPKNVRTPVNHFKGAAE